MSEKHNEIPIAGNIVEPGNAKKYLTGGWRAQRPIHDPNPRTVEFEDAEDNKKTKTEQCLWVKSGSCGLCWIYCPDNAVKLIEKDGKYSYEYDYDYCKGCGICANECPTNSIHMEDE